MKHLIKATVPLALCIVVSGCAWVGGVIAPLLPGQTGAPDLQTGTVTATPEPTPSDTPTETPTATPTATPSPTPADPYPVLKRYNSQIPPALAVNLAYEKYATPLDYYVALKSANLRAAPDAKAKKLQSVSAGERFALVAQVQGVDGKTPWFQVRYSDKKGVHDAYVLSSTGRDRSFRLGNMLARIQALEAVTNRENTVFIRNYKNRNGKPPALVNGSPVDEMGYNRSQSAPAYRDAQNSSFTYAPDGMLGQRLGSADGMSLVYFPSLGEERWVPDKYLSSKPDSGEDAIEGLTQAIVVDRNYQNIAVFEKRDGIWTLLSMNYISTGKNGGYSLPTPLGDFMVQDRVSKFYYYKDGTKIIDGYAPWGIRFCGGGYLHGVPRTIHYDANGKRVLPAPAEGLRSLGTTPQSHMCVRNYTSHAKFMYDWTKVGSAAVLVME